MAAKNGRGGQGAGYQVVRKNGPVPTPVSGLYKSAPAAEAKADALNAAHPGVTHTVLRRHVPATIFAEPEALARYEPDRDADHEGTQ